MEEITNIFKETKYFLLLKTVYDLFGKKKKKSSESK